MFEKELFLCLTGCKQKTVPKQMTVCKPETVYLCETELFEIELILCLAVNSY